MRFYTSVYAPAHGADGEKIADLVPSAGDRVLGFPAQGQVGRGNDFDKVHVVECWVVGHLLGPVERVDVVVGPRGTLGA